jgi:hypothetical protein
LARELTVCKLGGTLPMPVTDFVLFSGMSRCNRCQLKAQGARSLRTLARSRARTQSTMKREAEEDWDKEKWR